MSTGQKTLFTVIGIIVVLFLGAIVFFGKGSLGPKQRVELTMWGVNDSGETIQELAKDFAAYHKTLEGNKRSDIRINYVQIPADQYESILVNALAEDRGPDIFYIHNTWLPKHVGKLAPLPQGFMTPDQFQTTFVPVASQDLILNGFIYAFPLYIDTLALYYNADMYQDAQTARAYPAATWQGLLADASALALSSSNGQLLQGGIAAGTAETVTYAPDIYSTLLVQYGGSACNTSCDTVTLGDTVNGVNTAEAALSTYVGFATTGTWSDDFVQDSSSLTSDIDAFVQGKVAAIFGYADLYSYLLERTSTARKNITIRTAEIPQIEDPAESQTRDAFAQYWAPAVSRKSPSAFTAWQFLSYLSSHDSAQKYHELTGKPTARQDLIQLHQAEPQTGIFALQSKYAKSLRVYDMASFSIATRAMIDAVEDDGVSPMEALGTLKSTIQQSLAGRSFASTPEGD